MLPYKTNTDRKLYTRHKASLLIPISDREFFSFFVTLFICVEQFNFFIKLLNQLDHSLFSLNLFLIETIQIRKESIHAF